MSTVISLQVERKGMVEIEVSTLVIDADEQMYLRSCEYAGQKEDWKEAIKAQLVKHLQNIGVEPGFVGSETRYFEVSNDNHLSLERYEIKLLDLIAKIRGNEK